MGRKGGGAVAPWGSSDRDVASALLGSGFGLTPKYDEKGKLTGYEQTGSGSLGKAGEQYAKPTAYESQAGDILSKYDPNSWLSGVKGYLGQGQGSLDSALAGIIAGGAAGSDQALADTISGKNLDVTGGAYAKRNEAISSEMNKLLAQNLDTLGAAAQRSTGGVGAGSAGLESKRRAVTEAGSSLGNTLAQLSATDFARERAAQEAAVQTGLNLPIARSGALGSLASGYQGLGSILGQAGTAAGNLSLSQAGGLGTLGNQLAGRQLAGSTVPIEYLLQYLTAARQSAAAPQPSVLGSILGGLGGVALGLGTGGLGWAPFAAAAGSGAGGLVA